MTHSLGPLSEASLAREASGSFRPSETIPMRADALEAVDSGAYTLSGATASLYDIVI